MKEYSIDGNTYRLAGGLTEFQLGMQTHLVDWKRANVTEECGSHKHKGCLIPYDSMLPKGMATDLHPLYQPVKNRVLDHQSRRPFKLHKYVGHMASSQIACLNLFVPLLQHPDAAARALRTINPQLATIATGRLDKGFQIEFWPGQGNSGGLLNDHSSGAGTDSDIAIAYRDDDNRLCLWLIEHKLTEKEFTTCGGATSSGRTSQHQCSPAHAVVDNHDLCYYHSAERCRYMYWPLTARHPEVFPPERIAAGETCPFKGGLNQLWRNMVLALAVEDAVVSPFEYVHFSVVNHPDNHALEPSMQEFRSLTNGSERFSSFTSRQLIDAVEQEGSSGLSDWVAWYKELYRV